MGDTLHSDAAEASDRRRGGRGVGRGWTHRILFLMPLPLVSVTDISGIPAYTADIRSAFTGTLTFGVGQRDATARTSGLAHLIEHLVMKRVGKVIVAHNATTADETVSFYAQGNPAAVCDFLTRVGELESWIDPDLIILQGSINDRLSDAAAYPAAVNAVWDAMVAKYPGVPIVILGPAPHELPVGASTARIDRDLARLAEARGWWYISPVQDDWITDANYLQLIDVGAGRRHPSDAGHAYLAEKVAAALERFRTAPVTAADEAKPKPAK